MSRKTIKATRSAPYCFVLLLTFSNCGSFVLNNRNDLSPGISPLRVGSRAAPSMGIRKTALHWTLRRMNIPSWKIPESSRVLRVRERVASLCWRLKPSRTSFQRLIKGKSLLNENAQIATNGPELGRSPEKSSGESQLLKSGNKEEKEKEVSALSETGKTEEDKKKGGFDFEIVRWALSYLWPRDDLQSKALLMLSLLSLFLGKLLAVQVPFLLQGAVDNINIADISTLTLDGPKSTFVLLICYGLARVIVATLNEIKTVAFTRVSQKSLRTFARGIFTHLHALDSTFHLGNPSGLLSVAYVRGVRGFQTILFQIVFAVVPTLIELVLTANVLTKKFGPMYSLVTLATFFGFVTFTSVITDWRMSIRRKLVGVDNERTAFFVDSMANAEAVKLFGNEDHEERLFDEYLAEIQQKNIENTYSIGVLNVGQSAIFSIGLTTLMLSTASAVTKGTMTVGNIVAVNALLIQLQIPFNFIGYTYQEVRQGFVDMGLVLEFLKTKPRVSDSPAVKAKETQTTAAAATQLNGARDPRAEGAAPAHRLPAEGGGVLAEEGTTTTLLGEVIFENVSFSYPNSTGTQINGVTINVAPGETIALVGASGSGKSTCLRLLTRLFDVDSGRILIDQENIQDMRLSDLRERVGVVSQDTALFDKSVGYNIRYGRLDASDEEVEAAARAAQVHHAVMRQKEGYDTRVGERGAILSGGERQRVAIARTILRAPRVMLCDEVTSAVDVATEVGIMQALKEANRNRTCVMVAHRLRTIMHADRIYVMANGKVVEEGRHEDLVLEADGHYRRLWDMQDGQALDEPKIAAIEPKLPVSSTALT